MRIGYRRSGEGRALVLLLGFFCDSRVWRRQYELGDRGTLIGWDAPGCGRSSMPPSTYRMGDYAECLAGFIEELGIAPVHLVGNSFGGALALDFCARHPGAVRSLVLVGAYAGWSGSFPADVVAERLRKTLPDLDLPPEEVARKWMPGFVTQSAPAPLSEELTQMITSFQPAGMRPMVLALAEADLRPVLGQVTVPTLLAWGEDDVRSPLSVAEALHERLPASELVVIPGAGHLTQLEGADRFNRELVAFLERSG